MSPCKIVGPVVASSENVLQNSGNPQLFAISLTYNTVLMHSACAINSLCVDDVPTRAVFFETVAIGLSKSKMEYPYCDFPSFGSGLSLASYEATKHALPSLRNRKPVSREPRPDLSGYFRIRGLKLNWLYKFSPWFDVMLHAKFESPMRTAIGKYVGEWHVRVMST